MHGAQNSTGSNLFAPSFLILSGHPLAWSVQWEPFIPSAQGCSEGAMGQGLGAHCRRGASPPPRFKEGNSLKSIFFGPEVPPHPRPLAVTQRDNRLELSLEEAAAVEPVEAGPVRDQRLLVCVWGGLGTGDAEWNPGSNTLTSRRSGNLVSRSVYQVEDQTPHLGPRLLPVDPAPALPMMTVLHARHCHCHQPFA